MNMVPTITIVTTTCVLWALSALYLRITGSNSREVGHGHHTRKAQFTIPADDIFSGDIISGLPDEILSCILSHLTLQDAVKMSILSKRWRNMWATLSRLDMEWFTMSGANPYGSHSQICEKFRYKYIKNVDQVLRGYKHDHTILSFRCSFCFNEAYAESVSRWINFASHKDVESLSLQFICKDLSCSRWGYTSKFDKLYTISTEVLGQFHHLKTLYLESCVLKFESGLVFKRLTNLDLNYVLMDESRLQLMLSYPSTMERLRLRRCRLPNKLRIGDNLRSLKIMVIDLCSGLQEIESTTRSLNTFELITNYAVRCCFLNLSKLENVYVFVTNSFNILNYLFTNLATCVGEVKSLILTAEVPMVPTFRAIIFRQVLVLDIFMKSADYEYHLLDFLLQLLNSFPLLQKLNICLPSKYSYLFRHQRNVEYPVVHLHANLKEIRLGNFEVDFIDVARYLLMFCADLKCMVVTRVSRYYAGEGTWICLNAKEKFSSMDYEYIYSKLRGVVTSPCAEVIIV